VNAHGASTYLSAAAPVTLPAAPAAPTAWPSPGIYEPTRLTDSLRLLTSIDSAVVQVEPAPPIGDVSRVVVGYLRAAAVPSDPLTALARGTDDVDDDVTAPLVEAIARYAHDRGLTLLRVHRDDVTDDDARRPGFSACLRHLYLREASGIIVPTWSHLAPNDVLRRALCHNATSAGGTIQVVDPTSD
jgi:hypothetical protein